MGNIWRRLFGTDDERRKPPPLPDVPGRPRSIKIVVVGASTVGKTCMINVYSTNAF